MPQNATRPAAPEPITFLLTFDQLRRLGDALNRLVTMVEQPK
jgi:hypothetical protein